MFLLQKLFKVLGLVAIVICNIEINIFTVGNFYAAMLVDADLILKISREFWQICDIFPNACYRASKITTKGIKELELCNVGIKAVRVVYRNLWYNRKNIILRH